MEERFHDLTFRVRISIQGGGSNEDVHFGPGIAQLMTGIAESGSLNRAAKSMGMAYSKAWRIIREVEQNLGFALIERRGAHGSVLSEAGKAFLGVYEAMREAAKQAAGDVFHAFVAKE